MDLVKSYPSIFQVLWHSINPCFDIRYNINSNIVLKMIFRNWTSNYRDQKSTIKRCKWKGLDVGLPSPLLLASPQVSCTAIFKTNPTDRGMCCTFNALAAEEIYRCRPL